MASLLDNVNLPPPVAKESILTFLSNTEKKQDAEDVFVSIANENGVIEKDAFCGWYIQEMTKQEENAKKRPVSSITESSSSSSSSAPVSAPVPAPKKAKTGGPVVASTGTEPTLTAAKKTALLKSLVMALKASIKSKKFYNSGGSEECAAECVLSPTEFQQIFGSVGKMLAKLDKEGKEKVSSIVTNKYLNAEEVATVFGSLVTGLNTQTYNRPRNFSKQFKTGSADLSVTSASLTYSTNTQTLKVKFGVDNEGTGGGYGGFGWM